MESDHPLARALASPEGRALTGAAGAASLAVISSMNPGLALMLAAGHGAYRGVAAAYRNNELRRIREHIERLGQRIARDRHLVEGEFEALLLRPDVLVLQGTARDSYALVSMDENLDRLRDVIANRVDRPDDAIDEDLAFARAAMELSSHAVELLLYADEQGVFLPGTHRRTDEAGTWLGAYSSRHRDEEQAGAELALVTLHQHGMIRRHQPRNEGDKWRITPLGRRFLAVLDAD